MKPIRSQLLVVSLLALGALATIPAPVQARDPDNWSAVSLAALTGAINPVDINIDNNGEKVGLTYASSGNFHFLLCSSDCQTDDAQWTEQNADLTGASTTGQSELAWAGGTNWVFVGLMTGNTNVMYHSADDGATWTANAQAGTCSGCLTFDVNSDGQGTVEWLTGSPTALVSFYQTADYGVTSTTSSTISDNQGGITAPTGTISAQSARIIYGSSPKYLVEFQEANLGAGHSTYEVHSDDGIFWSIPFTTAGGVTKNPRVVAGCPFTTQGLTLSGMALAGTTASHLDWFGAKDGANNQYLCSSKSDGTGEPYPSAAPATRNDNLAAGDSTTNANRALATNGVQYIAAGKQGTSNYILYKPTNEASPVWEEVYTTPANTEDFAVTATPTMAYFAYADNEFGGRLTIAGAEMFDETVRQGSWCSNPNVTDFGYNYVEGVTYTTFTAEEVNSIGLSDGFLFTGTETNFDYLGKGWSGDGATYADSIFRIEADQEADSSVFRSAFSFETATPSLAARGTDGDLSTGSFLTHLAARFEESGDFWEISLQYNNGGAGPSNILPPVVYAGANPNDAHTFAFIVSTDGNGWIAVKDEETGEDIQNVTMSTSGIAGVSDLAGSDPMWSQWFIGDGTGAFTANTGLDDSADSPPNDEDSTCIFFHNQDFSLGENETVTGDTGLTPPSQVPPGSTSTNSAGAGSIGSVFENLTDSGTRLFFGFLLVFGIVWMGIRQGAPGAAIGALFLIGLIMAYAIGLVDLWVLLVLFVISLAAVWFLPKPNRSGV